MSQGATAGELERRRKVRRVLGLVMILISIVLVLVGQLVLDAYLHEHLLEYILYWSACTVFTVLALFTALVDMVLVRRESAREERRLMQETLRKGRVQDQEKDEDGQEY